MENPINDEKEPQVAEMRAEYDFSGGVRGKHYRAMQDGYVIYISEPDGSTTIKEVKSKAGVVFLEPDVLEYFPNSEAVNATLRSLIRLIPAKQSTQSQSQVANR